MKEWCIKLADRILQYNQHRGIVRLNIDYGFFKWLTKPDDIMDIGTHLNWMIDGYVLTFYEYFDKEELKITLEMLDNNDDVNKLIGVNMLYNLKINNINLKIYENGQ